MIKHYTIEKLYYNEIDGKTVISTCKTLQLENGGWVSNPSEELIYSEGWQDYVPPIPEPSPQTEPTLEDRVAAFERLMNVGTQIVTLDDEAALQVIALFPAWIDNVGKDLHVGERYYYDEQLWKVLQDHTAQPEWHPDVAQSLFVKVSIEEWPEWVQPLGSTDAYALGEKVTHNGKHWVSDIDSNVYEPSVYGWTEIVA